MTFGQRLAKIRTERNLSAREMGEKIGIAGQTIYHWEQDRSEPRLSSLVWLADYLGMTLDELVGRTVPKK